MGYYTRFEFTTKLPKAEDPSTKLAADISAWFTDVRLMEVSNEAAAELVKQLGLTSNKYPKLPTIEDIVEYLNEVSGYEFYADGDISPLGEAKWYDHEKEMLKVSSRFPTVQFTLDGEGEEQGDIWKQQFYGGKTLGKQKAKIVFDDVDSMF